MVLDGVEWRRMEFKERERGFTALFCASGGIWEEERDGQS